jgi:Saccharopine dehydrogenase NADP binding domain
MADKRVGVFGATGHTGRFVVKELERRGFVPVLLGRDARKLAELPNLSPGVEVRVATIADGAAMARALSSLSAVINCAGPFLDTADALIHAALRAGVHYLDVTAEQASAQATLERFASPAAAAGVTVVPAAAFYGGLADLLATAITGGWSHADSIEIAVALDGWWPTRGTRLTGKRNTARRFVVSKGAPTFVADPAPRRTWTFPAPFGVQDVVELPFSEIVTISSHIRSSEIHSFLNLTPLTDLANPDTPSPIAADDSGRSAQTFVMDVVAKRAGEESRRTARGRDIYAFTAPLVVEAACRILAGRASRVGAASLGELFDAKDFLASLRDHFAIDFTDS